MAAPTSMHHRQKILANREPSRLLLGVLLPSFGANIIFCETNQGDRPVAYPTAPQ